jgi:predicted nucleic acid-binding protein
MRALFDTNILIDYLCGKEEARNLLKQYEKPSISIITKMEILAGTEEDELAITKDFLENFEIIPLNDKVSEIATEIRRNSKIKLPDSIIWASAKSVGAILVTNNREIFSAQAPDIKHPY